jgi:hypothetical protein
MLSLARNGYTEAEVKAALHAENRKIDFRYELLDKNNVKKSDLKNVLGGSIEYNALAEIKRTARFTIRDEGNINFLSDRIKPYARLKMPGGWVEWPLGVFILSTPIRKIDSTGVIIREVEAYDQLQILKDDKVTGRYLIPTGTNFITAVKSLLDSSGITLQNLTPTTKILPVDREWDIGTPKLEIINDLLEAINYLSLWFDENGVAIAQPYVSPSERAPEYTYRTDSQSVICPEAEEEFDLFNVANRWVLVVSQPDRPVLKSIYTNENPDSPTSTINRGRIIVDFRQVDAPDQETLDALAQRLAFEASQVYQHVRFETAIMPFHSNFDVITLEYTDLGIADKYSECSWSFEFKAGARMSHDVRRIVNV